MFEEKIKKLPLMPSSHSTSSKSSTTLGQTGRPCLGEETLEAAKSPITNS